MKSFKTEGIILSGKNMFERDRLLTVYTPQYGKIRILAKSANSRRFRFGGMIDASNFCHFVLVKGNTFLILSQSHIIQTFTQIRKDYNRISLMFYFFQIILNATSDEQQNKELFDLLIFCMRQLEDRQCLTETRRYFHTQFLKNEGLLDKEAVRVSDLDFRLRYEEYTASSLTKNIPPYR